MRFLALVLILALVLPAAELLPAAEPAPEILRRVEELRRAARLAAPELWPGWDPTATPLAIHKKSEFALLVGHPKPPAPFRVYPTPLVSAPVFVADSTEGMALANTAQPFAGVLTSFISYDDLMNKNPVEEAVALGVHELFHAHQQKIAPRKFANILVVLWGQYPEFSARNRALLALEAEALVRAVRTGDAVEQRRQAANFLALRAERRKTGVPAAPGFGAVGWKTGVPAAPGFGAVGWKEMPADVARYESAEESSEGLARYMEYRVLEVAYPDKVELREKRWKPLENILNLDRDRERFYALGIAQAALLDRLRPGWEKEFEGSDALLDDLLGRAVRPAGTAPGLGGRDLNRLVEQQERELAKREEDGSRRLEVFLSKGRRMVVEVGAGKEELRLRGFNPNASFQLTPSHVVHTFLRLDLKGMKLEFNGAPGVYDKSQEAFWVMLPDEVVRQALERFAAHPEKLVLKTDRFLGEFENVEVEQRGNEVRVRPAAVLQRAPPPPKPEFVKPG